MPSSRRMYFLDNLRAVVVLLVIVLHASMTYMAFAPQWWYVVDRQNSLGFTLLVLLIDVPIMQIMFFIAGYFAMPSLQRHATGEFVKDKSLRIGLPWVLGVLLLAPPVTYLIYLSRGVPVGFWQFWRLDFWGKLYQQSVYWYLGVLFLMFLVLALVYRMSSRLQASGSQPVTPSWMLFAGFIALMSAGFFAMNLVFFIDAWVPISYLFMVQPLRVPLYVGYFALGIYAQRRGWLTPGGYRPGLRLWLLLCLFSGLAYLAMRLGPAAQADPLTAVKLATAILFNTFCLSTLLAGIGLFQRYVNGSGRVWGSLAGSSYAIYYFHPLFLYPLAYVFLGLSVNVLPKAILLMAAGIGLTWAFAEFVVRRVPGLRNVFYHGGPARLDRSRPVVQLDA